ncbi:MAG: hypothetical protein ACQES7_04375 [Pseudomonadota bacterium]
MKSFLYNVAFTLAKIALKALLSRDVKTTIYGAIDDAERAGGTGDQKMHRALSTIKSTGPAMLRNKTESHIRTLVELALDSLL